MAMAQTTLVNPDGFFGVFQLDNAAFRTALGLTADYASGLYCMKFMGGYLWIGTGAPTHRSLTVYDTAWRLDATTGPTTIYRPSGAESVTWSLS